MFVKKIREKVRDFKGEILFEEHDEKGKRFFLII
jgi:hypothetical protein